MNVNIQLVKEGEQVIVLVNGEVSAGFYEESWRGEMSSDLSAHISELMYGERVDCVNDLGDLNDE